MFNNFFAELYPSQSGRKVTKAAEIDYTDTVRGSNATLEDDIFNSLSKKNSSCVLKNLWMILYF